MPELKSFHLTATLIAGFDIEAKTLAEAKKILTDVLNANEANFGALPNGDPLIASVEIEGELDYEED